MKPSTRHDNPSRGDYKLNVNAGAGNGSMKTKTRPERRQKRAASTARKTTAAMPTGVAFGRPVTDLASDLLYPELAEDARVVLQTLTSSEKPIGARHGRWFTVRIMPYRTLDDLIEGVVITFTDITVAKTLETKLRAKQAELEKRVTEQTSKLERVVGMPTPDTVESRRSRNRSQRAAPR